MGCTGSQSLDFFALPVNGGESALSLAEVFFPEIFDPVFRLRRFASGPSH
jgi:hypothetical protein